jgi:hypothetical protein
MKKILLPTAIITIAFAACKKSSVETAVPAATTHLGLWKGKYSLTTNTQPTENVIYLFNENGTGKVFNGTDTATAAQRGNGSWALSGKTIVFQYTYTNAPTSDFYILFVTDDNFTKSIGQNTIDHWGTGNILTRTNNVAKGSLSLTKQ